MELIELYNQIQNPLNDPKVIEKLILAYANSSSIYGGIYQGLTQTVAKEYNKGQYYLEDANKFYAMMFNKWKNSIVALTRDEFIELYKKGSYGQDLIKLRNYLKSVKDVSTMQEANAIFFGNNQDKELQEAIEKYRWTSFGEGSGWVHVCSRYVTAKKDLYPNVEHRLYLDIESIDTYKMITAFVEKCDEHNLPYYFKFDQYANRDDTIVIYSSTETLAEYIEILQEIKKENPELIARMKEPPILTGKIDNWIGYGSEPAKTKDGKRHSFNEIRANLIEKVIDDATKKWIIDNRNKNVTYQQQTISLQDYIAIKSTEIFIDDLEKRFNYYEQLEQKIAQKNKTKYSQEIVIKRLGYTLQDIKSPQFRQSIYNILKNNMPTSLPKLCSSQSEHMNSIVMNIRNGKQIVFDEQAIRKVIKSLSINIAKSDYNFISSIVTQIKNSARQYGIDSDKFCFDIKAKEKIKALSEERKINSQHTIQPSIISPSKTEVNQINQTVNNRISQNEFNIHSLIESLNPELMTRKMKLPNGAEISAIQYIQEFVYHQLPENGIIQLMDGTSLSVKQFIEEGVMFECQEKYNGDFAKYMGEKTRNNQGSITITNSFETKTINPIEITQYINPFLLKKRIDLPNGAQISATQYIQEFYAPHIPSNGQVILSNGSTIPVTQYIEEILLWQDQKKYNGDINQILYNTTRNNTGIISKNKTSSQDELSEMLKETDISNKDQNIKENKK